MARPHTPLPYGSHPSAYGGVLRRRSSGRGARTLSVKHDMHVVLRSSLARGAWSFVKAQNRTLVEGILRRQADAAGVEILGVGNAGNHLHLRIRFTRKSFYKQFIRAATGEIALKIKRLPLSDATGAIRAKRFWDHRPYSTIISAPHYQARLEDYVRINTLEGYGHTRAYARLEVKKWRDGS